MLHRANDDLAGFPSTFLPDVLPDKNPASVEAALIHDTKRLTTTSDFAIKNAFQAIFTSDVDKPWRDRASMLLNNRYIPPPKTGAACQNCQNLNLDDPAIRGILGIPLSVLQRSSELGCPSCNLLTNALQQLDLQPPDGAPMFGITLLSSGAADDEYSAEKHTPLIMRLQTEYRHFAEVEIYREEGTTCPWPAIGPARSVAADAGAEESICLIRSWISDCSTKHKECTSPSQALLPDRVLDVRNGKGPSLYINQGDDHGIYAALSHSWGGNVTLTLTDSNIAQLQQGVALELFPQTFRHAIEVCRSLNIPYLWIDSLCIIQTSKTDWDVQGSKMADVYSRCFCVIAADGAQNSTEGFLRGPRRHLKSMSIPCPVTTVDPPGSLTDNFVYARKRGYGNRDVFNHHVWEADPRSKLSTRGWVLQESILAPRLLHFTAEETTWECKAISRCECQVCRHHHRYEIPLRQRLQAQPNHNTDWPHLVQEFSCRDLTYPSDRLPAISGLASWVQPPTSDVTYYAGLWSDSLPQTLFWFCIPHKPDLPVVPRPSRRVDPPCAPTWSWASITGRVVIPSEPLDKPNMRDIQVFCPPSGPNKYGGVSNGWLRASAYILRGKLTLGTNPELSTMVTITAQSYTGAKRDPVTVSGGMFLDVIGDNDAEIQDGDDVVIISSGGEDGVGRHRGTYLVLKSNIDVETGRSIYRRVGCYISKCEGLSDPDLGCRQVVTIV